MVEAWNNNCAAHCLGGGDKYATETRSRPTPTISVPKNDTITGVWNVHTLYACGKVKELTHEPGGTSLDWLRSGGLAVVKPLLKKATSCGIVVNTLDTNME